MTASAEPRLQTGRSDPPLGTGWREATLLAQQQALPPGDVVVTCSAPLAAGGLGRHVGEVVDALGRRGRLGACISGTSRAAEPGRGGAERLRPTRLLARSRVPVSPGWRTRAFMAEFDAYAARRLPAGEHLIAFNGQALTQFRAAQRRGYETVALISANSHLRQVAARHAEALRRYPLEGSWAAQLLERNLAEYERAARIYVASRYVRDSFLEHGFAEERLASFPLTPDPRYRPDAGHDAGGAGARRDPTRFELVYVGSLAVHKGVPLLIDAVRRLPHADLRLRLVGGWGTRGMRRFVERACAADRRIAVCPGDPLPHLRAASICVHAAYEDGFAYAPAEALACGVPVLVSEDTGMKELIRDARDGLVLPTGEIEALSEAIDAAYRGEELAAARSPAPAERRR
jgi:glycosyltransferase involved in cell wall biosynthesis